MAISTERARPSSVPAPRPAERRPDPRPATHRRRRSGWAAAMEHMVPGAHQMSDLDLEIRVMQVLQIMR
jgi:hypothetical protein